MDDPSIAVALVRFPRTRYLKFFLVVDLDLLISSEMPWFSSSELGHMT